METQAFGTLNYIVLLLYLVAIMLVGVYFARRQKSADDYFKAGGRIPGWQPGSVCLPQRSVLSRLCLFQPKPTLLTGHF